MSININISLDRPEEFRAFAKYLEALSGAAVVKDGPNPVETIKTSPTVEAAEAAVEQEQDEVEEAAPARVRGQASAGRTRRTKAEIAEDEAADAADAKAEVKLEDKQAISTGEERIDPQDKADEAAERGAVEELTADDLRKAMSAYINVHGMAAAQEKGADIFAAIMGEPPEGHAAWKVSLVPADQLKKAIDGWYAAAEA